MTALTNIFDDEDQMRKMFIEWLKKNNFFVKRSIRIDRLEMDIVACAPLKITSKGIVKNNADNLYVFEAKIATSYKLIREVIEQSITRLLFADYVAIVVPKQAIVWVNIKERKLINPALELKKNSFGVYSKKFGIISIDPTGTIEINRPPKKSGLTIPELRKLLLKKLRKGTSKLL